MMLAGGGDAPNDGHFRPIEIVTRPGSMFHPLPPSPCFLYGWPFLQSTEAMYHALAQATPEVAPAWSGGDILTIVWWGNREATGEPWADASPHPIGQGASARGDGASALMHHLQSATRFSPVEVWEARDPWLVERVELAPNSGGPGRYRGGLGLDFDFHVLEDLNITAVIERTQNPPPGSSAAARVVRTARRSRTRTGGAPRSPRTRACHSRKGPASSFGAVAAAASAIRPSATRLQFSPTCARATSRRSTRAGGTRTPSQRRERAGYSRSGRGARQ